MRGVHGIRRLVAMIALLTALGALVPVQGGAQTLPLEFPVVEIPFYGVSAEVKKAQEQLDAATARAFELEAEIRDLEADNRAIAERLAVTAERIRAQRVVVARAQARLAEARDRYETRLVQVYKGDTFDPLGLLFNSDSLNELLNRASVLSRLAEEDSDIVEELDIAAADALHQQVALEELLAQDEALKAAQDERLAALDKALAAQEALVADLTEETRQALLESRRLDAETRQTWRESSIPRGIDIPRATAVVAPYGDRTSRISAYMPRRYESTGESWTAVTSWYGPGFDGRGTASGQVFNAVDYTCASRTLPFGTVLALTLGDQRVIVYVNDRGPYVEGRDLDLSAGAARALGFWGVTQVHAEIIVPVDLYARAYPR